LKRRADVTHRYKYTGITHWEEYEGGFDVDYALDPDWRRSGELDKLAIIEEIIMLAKPSLRTAGSVLPARGLPPSVLCKTFGMCVLFLCVCVCSCAVTVACV
jgi:hypothetical protein